MEQTKWNTPPLDGLDLQATRAVLAPSETLAKKIKFLAPGETIEPARFSIRATTDPHTHAWR